MASGKFCCFSFTYCDYFSIFWRLCPFFMKTSHCTKDDTVAKHADCCSQTLLVPASPAVSACTAILRPGMSGFSGLGHVDGFGSAWGEAGEQRVASDSAQHQCLLENVRNSARYLEMPTEMSWQIVFEFLRQALSL